MEWRAEGVLLSVRRHGESAAIIEVFTEPAGRHAGVVRGGRRLAPVLQPGNQVDAAWRARLDDQIGSFTVEPVAARAAALMADPDALAALGAVCGLIRRALPEREPYPALYRLTCRLLDALVVGPDWPALYLDWEVRLLAEIGFGLDLRCCAVTGSTEGLAFVSPRTGRAVTGAAAGAWADRLIPLPACLTPQGGPTGPAEIAAGLRLTGHFLTRALCPDPTSRPLPEARARLLARFGPG